MRKNICLYLSKTARFVEETALIIFPACAAETSADKTLFRTLQMETKKLTSVKKEIVMIRRNLEKKKMLNKYFQSDGNQDETSQHLNLRAQKGGKPCTEHHTDE